MPTLVLVQDQFVKLIAMAGKVGSLTVHPLSVNIIAIGAMSVLPTLMMLVLDVKVVLYIMLDLCNHGVR